MALRINQNIAAYNAHRNLTLTDNMLSKSLERLSSGLRINRAADDAAGLSISEKMRSQVRGLQQAVRNAQDGISLIQTAEGALQETHAVLQRMRELAVQAANGTLTNEDRMAIQQEVDKLIQEVDRIADTTKFNNQLLLKGSLGLSATLNVDTGGTGANLIVNNGISKIELLAGVESGTYTLSVETGSSDSFTITLEHDSGKIWTAQVTANTGDPYWSEVVTLKSDYGTVAPVRITVNANLTEISDDNEFSVTVASSGSTLALHVGAYRDETLTVEMSDMSSTSLGVSVVNVSTVLGAETAISILDTAISKVSEQRSALGAVQNRLEHTIANLGVAVENISASESRIRDVDMAAEMVNFTRQQIMIQAGTAMLAQANAVPQTVLQLLR